MSGALYPADVWRRFASPAFVLASQAGAVCVATATTPASAESAELHQSADGRWFWRAHGSPWLSAALEVLCELRDNSPHTGFACAELESALDGLHIPAARRYCAVMVRELWQQAAFR